MNAGCPTRQPTGGLVEGLKWGITRRRHRLNRGPATGRIRSFRPSRRRCCTCHTHHSYPNHVERIALALGSDEPRRKVVGVFVCRLDASGTDRPNKIVTMAGYVGFLPEWSDFEIKAREVCARENVSVLHAKEFYDTKGDFAGWSRYKKESFVREIHDLSLGRLELGISFSVEKSAFLKGKREHKVAHNESAFGFCFRSIAYGLMHDVVVSEVLKKGENLTFILESGDQNGEDAHRIFNWLKGLNSTFDRALYSFGFADKRSSVGLQWADFLAVTTRRYADAYKRLGRYPEEPKIISILRDRIYMIDHVAESFVLVPKRGRRA